jgi:hypothetical protein
MNRPRLRYAELPSPRVEMVSTPDPECWGCDGIGYRSVRPAGVPAPIQVVCTCWERDERRTLLLVPGWISKRLAKTAA